MSGGIFVSYRRDDTRQAAGRLADGLADHFGSANIFRDIEGIDLGVEFAQALNQALEACVVMLVLIGPKWLDIIDAQGRRRLDDPKDWIRQEISTALRRGIRVVPVLIDGTPLPDESALSGDLKPLLRLNMTLAPNGVPMGVLNCNMQASPDFSRFVGMCQGANGQFPAQMFR